MTDVKTAHINGINGSSKKAESSSLSKNAKRRAKKKEQRAAVSLYYTHEPMLTSSPFQSSTPGPSDVSSTHDSLEDSNGSSSKVSNHAPSTLDLSALPENDEMFAAFSDVFARYQAAQTPAEATDNSGKGEVIYSDEEAMSESDEEDAAKDALHAKLSKRKQRQLRRLTVAELKQLVRKPDLVEWEDVTANDPKMLVQLKSVRNSIPVPPHWNLKRDYLQNKKGMEKPPFQLPPYIAATGIAEMKDALKEKESEQTLKAKTRERAQPKVGKIVIDYRKLHDAFFRFQTKPESLTGYGEAYYEGKEFETKFKERKPGDLSDALKEALSIPHLAPPPWLIAMQRYGPPPSYPQLRIPGLNAPIPEGAQWGFHPGGWGRPPLDDYGNPLYGDVFGREKVEEVNINVFDEEPERERWGEMEPEVDAEESEEEDEDEEEDEQDDEDEDHHHADGLETPMGGLQTPSGLETPSGMQSVSSSVPAGLETPSFVELRKGGRATQPQAPSQEEPANKHLYQVLPERELARHGQGFMASDHGYDVSHMNSAPPNVPVLGSEESRGTKRKAQDTSSVSLSLDPSELENMSESQLAEVRS